MSSRRPGTTEGGNFTTRGPLMVREADLASARRDERGSRSVARPAGRERPSRRRRRAAAHGANASARLRGILPAGAEPAGHDELPALLDDVGRSVLVSRSGVILLTIQFAILAGYAVVLVAGMLVERRRSEIALMRSRGASAFHLIRWPCSRPRSSPCPPRCSRRSSPSASSALLGSVGPTGGLGLATTAAIGQSAIGVSRLGRARLLVALTLPTLFVSACPAGARAAQGRQGRTTPAQRLGLDLALVAVAAVALWQLRLYGAPLTLNARGTLGLDPLLVAAPAIGLVAGAVLALRVVPRIAELGERVLVRGRGLVGIARRPPARPASAPLHPSGAAPDARRGPRDARRRSRRDLDPVAGRPGDLPGRVGRPGAASTTRPCRHGPPGTTTGRSPASPRPRRSRAPFNVGRTVREGDARRGRSGGRSPWSRRAPATVRGRRRRGAGRPRGQRPGARRSIPGAPPGWPSTVDAFEIVGDGPAGGESQPDRPSKPGRPVSAPASCCVTATDASSGPRRARRLLRRRPAARLRARRPGRPRPHGPRRRSRSRASSCDRPRPRSIVIFGTAEIAGLEATGRDR